MLFQMMHSSMISLEMMNNVHHLFYCIEYIGDNMKKILFKDYKDSMGIFINLNNDSVIVVGNEIHVPYEELLINHKEILDKNKKYFIYCNGGIKSKKAVNILDFYGYDVTLVYKE